MINVLLADDHAIVRQGLKALLSHVDDIQVIAEAVNGHDAVKKTKKLKPNVVVMDFSMPGLNGLEATRKIRRTRSLQDIKIIVLSMHTDEEYIMRFIKAGANGYLIKDSIAKDLIAAIKTVIASKEFISPSLSPETVKNIKAELKTGKLKSPLESLTNREREILQLIAEGLTNKGISQKLQISIKTVETHRSNIRDKLDLHDRSSLTRFALKHQVIDTNIR